MNSIENGNAERSLLKVVEDVLKIFDKKERANCSELYALNHSNDDIEIVIKDLKRKGVLYEPAPGVLQTLDSAPYCEPPKECKLKKYEVNGKVIHIENGKEYFFDLENLDNNVFQINGRRVRYRDYFGMSDEDWSNRSDQEKERDVAIANAFLEYMQKLVRRDDE